MKAWNPVESLQKMEVSTVPIWIQIENLELKYWGEKSLFKIVSQIGTPIRVDHFTKERNRLAYPRVLIEVCLSHKLEEQLSFEDEYGQMVWIGVRYEWKPILCTHCKGIGHESEKCKNKAPTKVEWVIKQKEEKKKPETDEEGFTKVSKGSKQKANQQKGTDGKCDTKVGKDSKQKGWRTLQILIMVMHLLFYRNGRFMERQVEREGGALSWEWIELWHAT